MIPTTKVLNQGLIVSVQAPWGSPIRDPEVIASIAEASLRSGAVGVRLESPEHIGAVRRRCPKALIIGLWKCAFPGSDVYITPGWREIQAVWSAGADVIALDATDRRRPNSQLLADLTQRARHELQATLMADIDSVQNGLFAAKLGCDWIGTTLYGHTEKTSDRTPPGLELLPDLRRHLGLSVRLICEGGIKSPTEARSALRAGADNVVVGTAITGVDLQVAAYCHQLTH
ncbi:N-acetylmannosamine-6-phosphate 2-epimerase [Synechococcus sp. M16CYN]|uniref:N-acetylmannosamine-6-phosphate 2-epimerase n=1 Tax=Synechococcus sp. M16CYN TaxID=3103139 RepID=UPI003247754C